MNILLITYKKYLLLIIYTNTMIICYQIVKQNLVMFMVIIVKEYNLDNMINQHLIK